jgi:hypothetical protein
VSEDSEAAFKTLLDSGHRDLLSPEFQVICEKQLGYITQARKPMP